MKTIKLTEDHLEDFRHHGSTRVRLFNEENDFMELIIDGYGDKE